MTTIKKILLVTAVILVQVSIASSQTSQNNFPVLKEPYLGQKPPGLTPEIFAPGIVSTSYYNHCTISFSPDGSEIFWAMAPLDSPARIYISKIDNGGMDKA